MQPEIPTQPTANEIKELTKLIESANSAGHQAVAFSGERLRVCVQVGETLNEWKKQIGHGKWESFVEEHWPDLTKNTRSRWQQLAIAKAKGRLNLDTARGLTHAYKLAGIIPDTEAASNAKPTTKCESYLLHIARLVAALQGVDIKTLSARDRSTLAERLQPVVKLHTQLTTADV